MLSSGSGAFGGSSAISQPPGLMDSPEGTTPDHGADESPRRHDLLAGSAMRSIGDRHARQPDRVDDEPRPEPAREVPRRSPATSDRSIRWPLPFDGPPHSATGFRRRKRNLNPRR